MDRSRISTAGAITSLDCICRKKHRGMGPHCGPLFWPISALIKIHSADNSLGIHFQRSQVAD